MCGITGIFETQPASSDALLRERSMAMAKTIEHRGPDGADCWVDQSAGIALAHRRLSIIDLSPAGAQPMLSHDERWVISYNGEIYNANDLRKELPATQYRGHSDTEVIVQACAHWGVAQAMQKLIGMFAIAIWDRQERELYLVRDRLGIKPLYWCWANQTLLFGSELKTMTCHPAFSAHIDPGAVHAFMRHAYVPSPYSIYAGVQKLEPGVVARINSAGKLTQERFWSMREVAEHGLANRLVLDDEDAVERLEALLKDAVGRRMVADVPLGAFLSGGIDSSTVVALMCAQSERPVKTFSIGFDVPGYNEATHAKAVAEHLETEHTEMYVTENEARDVIPNLPTIYDEPFGDASQIPTYLVSELTRQWVTVSLSGDGGDELFTGYNRYLFGKTVWSKVGWMPQAIRSGVANTLRLLSQDMWTAAANVVPPSLRPPRAGEKIYKLAAVLDGSSEEFYQTLISQWPDPDALMPNVSPLDSLLLDQSVTKLVPDYVERMQWLDTMTYLPEDILTKVDRASMAVSLEARVPLIDHRVVEFAWQLPARFKLRGGTTKWLLRQVLYRHVPQSLVERPKMGFSVPIDTWLRGPLRDWAESLLDEQRLRSESFFDAKLVRQRWDEHVKGTRNWQYALWNVLMFQAWLDNQRPAATSGVV